MGAAGAVGCDCCGGLMVVVVVVGKRSGKSLEILFCDWIGFGAGAGAAAILDGITSPLDDDWGGGAIIGIERGAGVLSERFANESSSSSSS